MKNEELILGALGKLIRENPVIGVDQATNSSFSLVTRSGKSFVVDLSSLDSNSDINELRKFNSSIEMAFSILNNRIADLLSTHTAINDDIQQLKDIDVESITRSLVETLLEAYDLDSQIKNEVNRQVKLMGDGVADAVSQSVIEGLSDIVKSDFEDLAKALDTTNETISSLVDEKTLKSAVSKAVAGLKKSIDSLPIISEERVLELIEDSEKEVELPVFVTNIVAKNGRSIAVFSDGSEKDLGVHLQDRVFGVAGDKGDSGLSAYQIAVKNGFVGTEQEWLDSLKGEDGTGGGGNAVTYVDGTEVTTRVDFIFNGTTSDTTGYFEISTDMFNHITSVVFYEGQSFIITNSEPVENRVVKVTIEDISPTGLISGYAFVERNSTALVGNVNKSIIPPPPGTPITVKIVGV